MKIGIMGYGEIGKSLHKVYKDFPEFDVKIKELDWEEDLQGIGVLNVCIPFTNSDVFVKAVVDVIKKYSPHFTIIHSTTKPGTILKIIEQSRGLVVHSPVIGVHPELYEGIKTFVKYIGYEDEKARGLAEEHLRKLGIRTKSYKVSKTTELAKLLSTTYYGLCIAWHGEMKKFCDKEGVDFNVLFEWNKDYGEGYTKLGKSNVVRPYLYAPEGKIGGHCIVPNVNLLIEDFDSLALDLVLKYA